MLNNYIYTHENSITNELCEDIIYFIENKIQSEKIQKYLIKELNSNIEIYKYKVKTQGFFTPVCISKAEQPTSGFSDIEYQDYTEGIVPVESDLNEKMCKTKNINIITINNYNDSYKFCVKKYLNDDINTYEKIDRIILPCGTINVLIYFWFLNDNAIIFWNNYKIDMKAGTFIIFPISNCFPYNFKKMGKYVIQGYLYN